MVLGLEQREAVTNYFECYLNVGEDGYLPNRLLKDVAIKKGFKMLIENDVKTEREILLDLLKDYNVLVPKKYFEEEEK